MDHFFKVFGWPEAHVVHPAPSQDPQAPCGYSGVISGIALIHQSRFMSTLILC